MAVALPVGPKRELNKRRVMVGERGEGKNKGRVGGLAGWLAGPRALKLPPLSNVVLC